MPAAPISLCLIVRDVAPIIERCLTSAAPHVAEVIIVDTGSSDRTKDVIAQACPKALVLDFNEHTHPEAFILDVEGSWKRKIPGPFTGKYQLANFGAARQHGWNRASQEFSMWMDADDTLEGAEKLIDITRDMQARGVDTAILNYDYDHDDKGNVTLRLPRERILSKRLNSKWAQPVHEVVVPGGNGHFYTEVNIRHHRTKDKLPPLWHHRNLKILVSWFEQNSHLKDEEVDPRMLFYMGMEARFHWADYALDCFRKYVKRSGWDEERAMAHFLSGMLHERAAKIEEAMTEYSMVTVEFASNPDGFFALARCAYYKNDWGKVIEWTEKGLEICKANEKAGRPTMLMEDPTERKWRPHVYLSVALMHAGRFERVIEICEEGLAQYPDEPHLKGNLKAAREGLAARDKGGDAVTKGIAAIKFRRSDPVTAPPLELARDIEVMMALQLWKKSFRDNPTKASNLLSGLPPYLETEPKIKEALLYTRRLTAREEYDNPIPTKAPTKSESASTPAIKLFSGERKQEAETSRSPPILPSSSPTSVSAKKLKIVLWTGSAWEKWSPTSIDTGIGGSETAAIHMSYELARRGHSVTVIGEHDSTENGVRYVHYNKGLASPKDFPSDVFIVSRQATVLAEVAFPRDVSFLWVHDIHCGGGGRAKAGILRADKVFALSSWHKGFLKESYPFLDEKQIIVTRNGIAPERFAAEPRKLGNKLIYASSPERAIERLLFLWPRIRAEVPDVELHVYYGFGTWRSMCELHQDKAGLEKIAYYERLLSDHQVQNVTFHGRVGQRELAEAYLSSKVWANPTWFTETSCISAMEAQAAECVPVTSDLAALHETVRHGILLKGQESSVEYGDAFVQNVVRLLKDEEFRLSFAKPGRKWALENLGWDKLAAEWEEIFFTELTSKNEVSRRLAVPAYQGK